MPSEASESHSASRATDSPGDVRAITAPAPAPAWISHASVAGHVQYPQLRLPFIEELKHRNIVRVAVLYLAVCWVVLEPVHVVFHMLEVPLWANQLVLVLMAVGFPSVLLFAWIFELTPDGIKPTMLVDPSKSIRPQTGRRIDRAIIVILAIAVAYF